VLVWHEYDGSNFDAHEPRKGLIVSFVAADVLFSPSLGGIYTKQQDSYRAMHKALKEFAPGREHIVPTGEEEHNWPTAPSHTHNGAWAASDVAEKWWTELFLPGETNTTISTIIVASLTAMVKQHPP
jgi:hypothetical protein